MTPAFNPIDYSTELEAAGVEKAQAAVHAKALSTVLADVAYTHDLVKLEGNLRKEIQHTEEKLTARIESVRTDLSTRIEMVQVSVDSQTASVRGELDIVRKETNLKFFEVNSNIDRLRMETASKFVETNSKFTEVHSKFYSLNVEMVIHRWALGILMAMSATTLALVVRPLLA